MPSWSKDPVTGMPNFVKPEDVDNVSLVTTTEAQDPTVNATGVTTPGWVEYKQHTRADGRIVRRVNTLVSFKHVPDPEV